MAKANPYKIHYGLTKPQVDQLIYFSANDPLITENTNDPSRFLNKESYTKWLQKGRTVYSLTDTKGKLKGIAWFGIKKPSIHFNQDNEYKYTFAIRLYADARGRGLSKSFMEAVFRKFTMNSEFKNSKEKGVWLLTRGSNTPAIKLYKTFGFNVANRYDGNILMIYNP